MNSLACYSSSSEEEEEDVPVKQIKRNTHKLPTLVYCKVDVKEEAESILQYTPQLHPIKDLHISLSRTLFLTELQVPNFISHVQQYVNMKPFLISFAQVSMLVNDDKTCSFLTMEIGQGYDKLKECLVSIDRVMTRHQLPVFYNPPRFHTSIAWSPHEFSLEKIPESVVDEIRYKEYSVRSIYIKTGNEVTQIPLT